MTFARLRSHDPTDSIAAMRTTCAAEPTLGHLLRRWRAARGVSQLELGARAGFSARHVSFVETGRTQPSRQALLILAGALAVPLRERNRLLEVGGFAHVCRHTPLAAEEMSHVRGVLQFLLDRHEPYAAIVLDRYANCLMGNRASARMLGALVDASLITAHANHLRLVFHPRGARRWVVNCDEVARHLYERAERDLSESADETGAALLAELRGYGVPPLSAAPNGRLRSADLLLPIHIRKDDLELRVFSTIMTLGTPRDITLQERRLETFFPADRASEEVWTQMTGADIA